MLNKFQSDSLFSVASLLSSLHQLKEGNLDLEDSVDRMVQRRDHLLAVRARLLALSSLTVNTERPSPDRPTGPPSATSTPLQSQVRVGVGTFFTQPRVVVRLLSRVHRKKVFQNTYRVFSAVRKNVISPDKCQITPKFLINLTLFR